jgi:hypothetical protein
MRVKILVLTLFLLTPLTPATSAAPPKTGAPCAKVNLTQSYKGKSFTCTKSGKKLIWGKGVQIRPAASAPTLSPTPMPTQSAPPSPTPKPSPTQKTISERWNDVDKTALNIFNRWAPLEIPKDHKVTIRWTLSERADLAAVDEIKKRYDIAARFWAPYSTVTKDFQVLIANHNEAKWICDIKRSWLGINQPDCEFIESNGRPDISTAGQSQKGNRNIDMYQVKNLQEMSTRQFIGRVEHEFTHNIFYEQSENYQQFMPCWSIEGGAEFFGILIARRLDPDGYIQARNIAIDRVDKTIEAWSVDDWVAFLNETDRTDIPNRQGDTCGPVRTKIYHHTFLANEYLVLKLGIPGYLEIIRKASNSSWEQAIFNSFGQEKQAFYREMGTYMKEQYKLVVANFWSYRDLYSIPQR